MHDIKFSHTAHALALQTRLLAHNGKPVLTQPELKVLAGDDGEVSEDELKAALQVVGADKMVDGKQTAQLRALLGTSTGPQVLDRAFAQRAGVARAQITGSRDAAKTRLDKLAQSTPVLPPENATAAQLTRSRAELARSREGLAARHETLETQTIPGLHKQIELGDEAIRYARKVLADPQSRTPIPASATSEALAQLKDLSALVPSREALMDPDKYAAATATLAGKERALSAELAQLATAPDGLTPEGKAARDAKRVEVDRVRSEQKTLALAHDRPKEAWFDPETAKDEIARMEHRHDVANGRDELRAQAQAMITDAAAQRPQLVKALADAKAEVKQLDRTIGETDAKITTLDRQIQYAGARADYKSKVVQHAGVAQMAVVADRAATKIENDKRFAEIAPRLAVAEENAATVTSEGNINLARDTLKFKQILAWGEEGKLDAKHIKMDELRATADMMSDSLAKVVKDNEKTGKEMVQLISDPAYQQAILAQPKDKQAETLARMTRALSASQAGADYVKREIVPAMRGENRALWSSVLAGSGPGIVDKRALGVVNNTRDLVATLPDGAKILERNMNRAMGITAAQQPTVERAVAAVNNGQGAEAMRILQRANLGGLGAELPLIRDSLVTKELALTIADVNARLEETGALKAIKMPFSVVGGAAEKVVFGKGVLGYGDEAMKAVQAAVLQSPHAAKLSVLLESGYVVGKVGAGALSIVLGSMGAGDAIKHGDIPGTVGNVLIAHAGVTGMAGVYCASTGVGVPLGLLLGKIAFVEGLLGSGIDLIWGNSKTEDVLVELGMWNYKR